MTTILHISASPRGPHSLSRQLGAELIERLLAHDPGARIARRDLVSDPLPHLDGAVVAAMFTPPASRDAGLADAIRRSDALVDELIAADIVVIDTPMFNWTVPSALKAWIDHIVRPGRTFAVPSDTDGYRTLLADRPVYLTIASGGVYTHGTRGEDDFLTPYLRHVLGMIGLKDLRYVHAEGVVISTEEAYAAGRSGLDRVLPLSPALAAAQ